MDARIPGWIRELGDADGRVREKARNDLVDHGAPAVEALLDALAGGDRRRYEALKALAAIGDPRAVPAFLAALDDPGTDRRWVAAEGLAVLGRAGLEPVLLELTDADLQEQRRKGAHHVLERVRDPSLEPIARTVLDAFRSPVAHLEVPRAAYEALEALRATPAR